jgi:predicted metal-dependent phosphoesterase TrpH
MPADLHIHTTFSDGTDTPEKVVELAKAAGLTAIAITDHDGIAGIEPAVKKGNEVGLEVVPGIELTSETPGAEIHVLGYFIDYRSPQLLQTIAKIQNGRRDRIYKICDKLKGLGIDLRPEEVFQEAGHLAAGRPHVARVLMAKGIVQSFKEAFIKYLDSRGPAYVPHYKLSPEEAIKLIVAAKGIPVFGHPAVSDVDQIIPELMAVGIAGIEVYYGGHNQSETEHYRNLAEKFGLLVTGGSDYHGEISGRESGLGDISISDELMEKLKNEHLRRNKP